MGVRNEGEGGLPAFVLIDDLFWMTSSFKSLFDFIDGTLLAHFRRMF
jgi:hypothetical protein